MMSVDDILWDIAQLWAAHHQEDIAEVGIQEKGKNPQKKGPSCQS